MTASVSGTEVYATTYERDKLGRIARKVESIEGSTTTFDYQYDPAGRLTQVVKDGLPVSTLTYDENSNRTSRLTPQAATVATYDGQDRLVTYGDTTYGYTENGELRSKTQGSQTISYDYDELGNLRHVVLPDGIEVDYLVDGRNRRVGKRVEGVLVQGFLYQGALAPVAELNGAGTVVAHFVYGSRPNVPDYVLKGGKAYRILSDHLGSPRLVVDSEEGTIVQRMDYDEWGTVTLDTNPGFQPFGFAGGLYDRQTGLVRFGARDYDPEVGRWTAKDPIGFGGGDSNLVGYAGADPVNIIDPNGLWGFGVSLAETTDLGVYAIGAGQTGSVGGGVFADGLSDFSSGGFASWGGFAGGPGWGVSYPRPCPKGTPFAVGAFAGIGANLFVTNAKDVRDLSGPFTSTQANGGWGLKLGGAQLQVGTNAAGETIWAFSFGGPFPGGLPTGVGAGGAISVYPTNTVTTSDR